MMSSTSDMFASKSPTMDCVESTSRCSDGPHPATGNAVSSGSDAIFFLGRTDSPRLAASRAGPISLGTVPLVIVCPGEKNFPGPPVDTRSRYCSPIADTECTLAEASTGVLYRLSMLSVALTPCAGGSTLVTRPTWLQRYVTFEVRYRPPDAGSSATSRYWPTPSWLGIRR